MNELPIIQPPDRTDSSRSRRVVMHLLRIALVVGVVLMIRFHTSRLKALRSDRLSSDVTAARIKQLVPSATSLEERPDSDGAFGLKDSQGESVGRVMQTSPLADHIIGFSGPTNVLVVLDPQGTITAVDVIESGDTREHVRQILERLDFLSTFNGMNQNDLRTMQIDAVSGATLTSLAIAESIAHRVNENASNATHTANVNAAPTSLRFPDPISITECQQLFPDAVEVVNGSVRGQDGTVLGSIQPTSPAADNTIGYQGPTNTFIGFDTNGHVIGTTLGGTYDNEKYVAYVREDDYFRSLFDGKTLQQLADIDLEEEQIEGVSGATMTSMAVANGIVAAAQQASVRAAVRSTEPVDGPKRKTVVDSTVIGTMIAIVLGITICFSSLRGKRWVRVPFQLFLVVYLGLMNGGLISQAMFAGWAQNGIPWLAALGLVLLSFVAFVLPATTGRNTYCTHLCPHGAAQQLLRNRIKRRRFPKWVRRGLKLIPLLLLVCVVLVAMRRLRISLVDIEAFDAYVPLVAGVIPIIIADVGLAASLFEPMAYCRYGCPTGSLLDFFRFNRRSDRFTRRDAAAVGIFVLTAALYIL